MSDIVTVICVDLDGAEVPGYTICGRGGNGIVVKKDQYAIKIPKIVRECKPNEGPVSRHSLTPEQEGDYDERIALRELFDNEKAVYRRLGDHDGIVKCLNAEAYELSIKMSFMKNGDLRHYLAQERPDRNRQISWFTQMAQTLAYIHSKRVLVADIRSDNLLLNDNFAVLFCDFGNATIMPLGWDLEGSDEDGYSVCTDLGEFGALMYQIIEDKDCKFDLFHEWKDSGEPLTLPPRDSLPSTDDVWLGNIIEKCWTQGFNSARDLAAELSQVVVD